jgi:hypothetical protein
MGDQGKAVGCVPPTALLFEEALNTQDQQNKIRDQSEFSRLVSIIGPPGEFQFDLNFVF